MRQSLIATSERRLFAAFSAELSQHFVRLDERYLKLH